VRSAAGELRSVAGELTVTELNDQHAFVSVADGFELTVGDLVGCGISHPCTAFDRWPLLPVVDDDYTVVDAVRTYF
jgi:D-serine deaminase-like pyridoxal phosphate-dependent protein